MKLVFLGTAGYHPTDKRQTSCVMIPEIGLVLDAGTGFYRVRDRIETPNLFILLSHAHLDHVCGLTFMIDVAYKKIAQENISVIGKRGHLGVVERNLFSDSIFPVKPKFSFLPLEELCYRAHSVPMGMGAPMRIVDEITNEFTLHGFGVKIKIRESREHPGYSVGYRVNFKNGKSVAYVTDTTTSASDDEAAFVKGVDLLIHECNFTDEYQSLAAPTGHSYTSKVNELALKAGVKRLVVTHVNPLDPREDPTDQKNAKIKFPDVSVAYDGLELDI